MSLAPTGKYRLQGSGWLPVMPWARHEKRLTEAIVFSSSSWPARIRDHAQLRSITEGKRRQSASTCLYPVLYRSHTSHAGPPYCSLIAVPHWMLCPTITLPDTVQCNCIVYSTPHRKPMNGGIRNATRVPGNGVQVPEQRWYHRVRHIAATLQMGLQWQQTIWFIAYSAQTAAVYATVRLISILFNWSLPLSG